MISYPEALRILELESGGRRLPVYTVPASGLPRSGPGEWTLGEDVASAESIPEFDNSAVDGFAVRACDLGPGLNRLPVRGRALPGECPQRGLPGTAFEIMTGAPLPEGGFDALVKVENVRRNPGSEGLMEIEFEFRDASGAHIRVRGSDYRAGDCGVRAGTALRPRNLMGLAALGIREVPLYRKPRIWLISTGQELVDAFREERVPGKIRNSSAPYLVSALTALGCEVRGPFAVSDEVERGSTGFEEALRAALAEGVDAVISTGAVSMGIHDRVKEGFQRAGGAVRFHGVAIRPGKPILFGTFPDSAGTVFFGLPGNPISTCVGLEFFVRPWLRGLRGQGPLPVVRASLQRPVTKPGNLRCFYKAEWSVDEELRSRVRVLAGQGSSLIHPLEVSNAWAILPEGVSEVPAGAAVEVVWMEGFS